MPGQEIMKIFLSLCTPEEEKNITAEYAETAEIFLIKAIGQEMF
jgi:hypothetical protein